MPVSMPCARVADADGCVTPRMDLPEYLGCLDRRLTSFRMRLAWYDAALDNVSDPGKLAFAGLRECQWYIDIAGKACAAAPCSSPHCAFPLLLVQALHLGT